jgi:hypothetical protein
MKRHGNNLTESGYVVLSKGEDLADDVWDHYSTLNEHIDELWRMVKVMVNDSHIVKVVENLQALKGIVDNIDQKMVERKRRSSSKKFGEI